MKMRKLVSLIALLMSILLLSACGGEEEVVKNEDVLLSNIRYSWDDLTEEEAAALAAATDMVSAAVVDEVKDCIILENTTGMELDVTLCTVFYNENGTIVDEKTTVLNSFYPGDRAKLLLYLPSTVDVVKTEIAARFPFEGKFLLTDYVPCETLTEIPATIAAAEALPYSFAHSDYKASYEYMLTAVELEKDRYSADTYDILLTIEKTSGPASSFESVDYRIYAEDGAMYKSGSVGMHGLKSGETLLARIDYVELLAGNYTIEIY